MNITKEIKDKYLNMDMVWVCSGNTIIENSINKAFTGLDLTLLPIKRVKVVYLEDFDFNDNMIVSLISKNKTNIPRLVINEMDYYRNICKSNGVEFSIKQVNRFIQKYGYKMDERIPLENKKIQDEIINANFEKLLSEIIYNETFNYDSNKDSIIIKVFKVLYVEFYKYIYYIFQNLSTSKQIEVDLTSKFTRLTIYERIDDENYKNIYSVDEKIQKFIDTLTVEIFDFPFLMEMIDEMIIYKPLENKERQINLGFTKDIRILENNPPILTVQNLKLSNYAYIFTEKLRNCYIYSNPFTNLNIDLDLGKASSIIESINTVKALYIDLKVDDYARIYSAFNGEEENMPQIRDEDRYFSEVYKFNELKLNKLKIPISKTSKRMKILNEKRDNNIKESNNHIQEHDTIIDDIGQDDKRTENEKIKNETNLSQKILDEKHIKMYNTGIKDDSETWFEAVRNTIPILKEAKKTNRYKNMYHEVNFLKYRYRLDNLFQLYDSQANYPEYELNLESLDELYKIYPEIDTIGFDKSNIIKMGPSRVKLNRAVNKLVELRKEYLEKLESYRDKIEEISSKNIDIVNLNKVKEEDLKNYLYYDSMEDALEDIFKLSINNYEDSKLYNAYKEMFYMINIYDGEKYPYKGEELDRNISYYLNSDKKFIEISRINRILKDNVEIWRDLYHNLNKFYDKNIETIDYDVIEDVTEVIIYKLYNIIETFR